MLWFTGHDSFYTPHENMDAGDYTVQVELPSYVKLTDFKVVLNEQCELPVARVHAVSFSRTNVYKCAGLLANE